MSEEQTPKETSSDDLGNLKQEMNRKLSNTEQKLSELAAANKALLDKLSALTTPKTTATSEDDMDKIWYEDPKKAAAKIKEQTKAEIMAEYQRDQEFKARAQSTLNALVNDYPELNDASSELTKKAVEYYNALPDSDKSSPTAYKLAVKDAASDLGMLPMKRRPAADDAYVGSSSGGYNAAQSRKNTKKDDLDARTIAFAKLVGVNVDDPKVMDSLKQKSKRTSWNRYE